ncbi:hypothetical protein MON38_14985 [Hymenobacter sp. DH14]|uniref:Uncharacterized protein n=1 Tax=Hymenobacter cyanobacteriorum TaxID=2926463 RepID=A0A9X1VHJ0_9BACT|nr:hypothetical protein [Hymenobacter cyanobacteriorum]MCI1188730.1 hypothetical protein [Hymenobacter cyanobacteriorum]
MSNTFSYLDFFRLAEIIDGSRSQLEMNQFTHQQIIAVSAGIKGTAGLATPASLNSVPVVHIANMADGNVLIRSTNPNSTFDIEVNLF